MFVLFRPWLYVVLFCLLAGCVCVCVCVCVRARVLLLLGGVRGVICLLFRN